jgi:hypothetical protein
MSSETDWTETRGKCWDFAPPATDADSPADTGMDVGYEAALPGLQALYADAAELQRREPRSDES